VSTAAVLVAESEPGTRGFLERHLTDDGFAVLGAGAGGEALALAERNRPDLVLVGSPLADAPALELCRRFRSGEPGRTWDRDVPLILLAEERVHPLDRARALEHGCDDFLEKPFHYEELVARIRAVLRRATPGARDRLEAGDIVVDRPTRRVTVAGEEVPLSGKEYELLVWLASDPRRVFTKDELLQEVWGFRSSARTRTLDTHASRLRRKLADRDSRPYVVNVWGVGYRLL
jgi:DNA-binding response OmpR family regulator